MEIKVKNEIKESGGTVQVSTDKKLPVATLLGATCQEKQIPMSPKMGLYTRENELIFPGRKIASYNLKSGDVLYLRNKAGGDDLLFYTNWRILAAILLIISIIALIIISAVYAGSGGRIPFVYGIVIDAGSSHSEATLYHWNGAKYNGTGKAEEKGHVESEANGISELTPRFVQTEIGKLLEYAKTKIPEEERNRTSVFLGATAGMRLLKIRDPILCDSVLLAAENAIKKSGMVYGNADILTGQDEGLSAWLSSNYLLDKLPRQKVDKDSGLVGALDCGGASTQIAFDVPSGTSHEEVRVMKLFGNKYSVFARTYLCYGVNEAYNRYRIRLIARKKYDVKGDIESPCHNGGYEEKIPLRSLVTPCTTHPNMPDSFKEKDVKEIVTFVGTNKSEECESVVQELFNEELCKMDGFVECFKPLDIDVPEIHYAAFSAFSYTMSELKFKNGSLDDLKSKVKNHCSEDFEKLKAKSYPGKNEKYSYQACFKANYITKLIINYGVNEKIFKNVKFTKEAKGYNFGWSLGYMINATNAIPEASPTPSLMSTTLFVILLIILIVLLIIGIISAGIAKKRKSRMQNSQDKYSTEVSTEVYSTEVTGP